MAGGAEGPQTRQALADGERTGGVSLKGDDFDWPRDLRNKPMIKITCAAAELIPTVQYGNVTVGPVTVTRFVRDLGDENELEPEDLLKQINDVQTVCERAVAEERQSIQALMRSRIERSAAA
jgi:hypothetical protein